MTAAFDSEVSSTDDWTVATWSVANSLLMFASNLYDGDAHCADQMPIVLAGHAGGLQTGRVLDYLDKGAEHRRACSLYLSMMDCMGVKLDRFGDTDQRLPGLFA